MPQKKARTWPRLRDGYDEGRDRLNHGLWLLPLSTKALKSLETVGPREVKQMVRGKQYPFNRLNRENLDALAHLSGHMILLSAECLIEQRSHPEYYRQK